MAMRCTYTAVVPIFTQFNASGITTIETISDRLRLDLTLPPEPGGDLLGAASLRLPFSASYTPALVSTAKALLERDFRHGVVYHKAGVFLTDSIDDDRRMRLMKVVNYINRRHGSHIIRMLAAGNEHRWEMRRARLSGRYTTRLDEVLRVRV